MFRNFGIGIRRALAAGTVAMAMGTMASQGQAKETAYTLSLGTDFTSHFISYGADVWGGGGHASPFSSRSTIFSYGTLTAQFTDNLSGFVNVWSDINNNAESSIGGGAVQEIDLNVGLTLTLDKFSFTAANGAWLYAGDQEGILDFTVAYNDAGLISESFSINPSVTLHYRYQGNGAQDTGYAIVPGIKPTITVMKDSKYPVSLALPTNIAFFDDGFQGGDSGLGFFSVGFTVSVPLSFIPEKYGAWSASGNVTYYITPHDQIPGNPEDSFVVTTLSIGMTM